jgi:hypothetical protein
MVAKSRNHARRRLKAVLKEATNTHCREMKRVALCCLSARQTMQMRQRNRVIAAGANWCNRGLVADWTGAELDGGMMTGIAGANQGNCSQDALTKTAAQLQETAVALFRTNRSSPSTAATPDDSDCEMHVEAGWRPDLNQQMIVLQQHDLSWIAIGSVGGLQDVCRDRVVQIPFAFVGRYGCVVHVVEGIGRSGPGANVLRHGLQRRRRAGSVVVMNGWNGYTAAILELWLIVVEIALISGT